MRYLGQMTSDENGFSSGEGKGGEGRAWRSSRKMGPQKGNGAPPRLTAQASFMNTAPILLRKPAAFSDCTGVTFFSEVLLQSPTGVDGLLLDERGRCAQGVTGAESSRLRLRLPDVSSLLRRRERVRLMLRLRLQLAERSRARERCERVESSATPPTHHGRGPCGRQVTVVDVGWRRRRRLRLTDRHEGYERFTGPC